MNILTFDPMPGGAPPAELAFGSAERCVMRPTGGAPLVVLRHRADVLAVLTDPARFAMAGAHGGVTSSPLTGAEMQSPDGGLLNMDPPALTAYRRAINGLFTRSAAARDLPRIRALALKLCGTLDGLPAADVLAGFARPFASIAISSTLGVPREHWDGALARYAASAFAPVPAGGAAAVAAAWEQLYTYFEPLAARRGRLPAGLTAAVTEALQGHSPAQIAHCLGTVSNGFGAVLPVLAVSIAEVLQHPEVIAGCRTEEDWSLAAAQLLSRRALFPVALPRVALRDADLPGMSVAAGTVVLPSLYAAAWDPEWPVSPRVAFGPGQHVCPGAHLSQAWLTVALATFFGAFPHAHLAGGLEWQRASLSVPKQILVGLH